ncbi:hypothetical protein EJ05DRAFT_346984 [Pseudovirgaria hyperparasitica]|uniref:Uncharacterized protein n=1 Tax=Pseudovirgaria hyperparasitica TaxID=470096 RepID=A0A6A6W8R3_9PEZI|nr:uncharacterized protein EJ05DRAFT_346984 [Pseudovirgaria hyperparasitica]KAF2758310.1 hypothetical protein EJ05DRAFT_346984 [Pseudovirgaria hyperparasitica]
MSPVYWSTCHLFRLPFYLHSTRTLARTPITCDGRKDVDLILYMMAFTIQLNLCYVTCRDPRNCNQRN